MNAQVNMSGSEENGITIVADQVEVVGLDLLDTEFNTVKIHSVDQIAQLAGMMQEFGFTVPILVDNLNRVIAGRCRCLAARALGMERVPVVRTTSLSDSQIQALMIADNKIGESEWDIPELKVAMEALQEVDAELLSMTGFDFEEIDDLLDGSLTDDADDGDDAEKVSFFTVGSHKIEIEDHEKTVITELLNRWVKKRKSYKGAITRIIEGMQCGPFSEDLKQ